MKAANIMSENGDVCWKPIADEFRVDNYKVSKKDILDVVTSGMDLTVAWQIAERRYDHRRALENARYAKEHGKNVIEPEPIEKPSRPVIIMKHEEPVTKMIPLKKEEPTTAPVASSMSLAIIFKTVSDSDLVCELRSRGYEVTASKYVVL